MIAITRFLILIAMTAFSSLFTGSFVYSIRALMAGGRFKLDTPLFLESVYWCGGILIVLMLFGSTIGADFLTRLFLSVRKKSIREESRIYPILERVQSLYQNKYGSRINVRVCMMDVPHINGMALGRSTIAVSTGLLKTGNDDEVSAVMAHEIGHLHHHDGGYNVALAIASIPTLFLCAAVKAFFFSSDDNDVPFFGIGLFIVFSFFFAYFSFFWLLSLPILLIVRMLDSTTIWPSEYRADRFVTSLGLAPAMIELFERIEDEDIRNKTGFLSQYLYSHPPTALRIDRLERALIKQQNMVEETSPS